MLKGASKIVTPPSRLYLRLYRGFAVAEYTADNIKLSYNTIHRDGDTYSANIFSWIKSPRLKLAGGC